MNEAEAYGENVGWVKRSTERYEPGDVVELGPAYQMGGSYVPDGKEGTYTVLSSFGPRDYYLAKGIVPKEEIEISLYDVIAPASRLTRRVS